MQQLTETDVSYFCPPEGLSSSLLQQAQQETAKILKTPENFSGRVFVKGLVIDPEGCVDRDDAIWAEEHNGRYAVHVSIADVAAFIKEGSALNHIARLKGFTRYRGDAGVEPLFPKELSEGKLSLLAGQSRLTMTISIGLSSSYDIEEVLIRPTYIISPANLTYEDAALMREDVSSPFHDVLVLADRISRKLHRKDDEKTTERREVPGAYRMHQIISDFMALANKAVAKFAIENELGIIYRNFEYNDNPEEPSYGYYSNLPKNHEAVGGKYTHISAPIRRAPDIFAWHRIKEFLSGERVPDHVEKAAARVARRINAAAMQERLHAS